MIEQGAEYLVLHDFEHDGKDFYIGDRFRVLWHRNKTVACEFERNVRGHSCNGSGKKLHCWNIEHEKLTKHVGHAPRVSWEL